MTVNDRINAVALRTVNELLAECLAVYNEQTRSDWASFEPTLLDLAVARGQLEKGCRKGAVAAVADARACLAGNWDHFRR